MVGGSIETIIGNLCLVNRIGKLTNLFILIFRDTKSKSDIQDVYLITEEDKQ